MACDRWETEGLLFTSGELDEAVATSYNEHIKECEPCRDELAFYSEGKESFFSPQLLSENPSSTTDDKIIKHCSVPVKPTFFMSGIGNLVKTGSLALLVLMLGVSAPVYFSAVKSSSGESAVASVQPKAEDILTDSSIAKDSLDKEGKVELKRGNLNMNGVIHVELSGE